jgi:hypothetical protein
MRCYEEKNFYTSCYNVLVVDRTERFYCSFKTTLLTLKVWNLSVLRIRIRIHMFLGLPDLDPLVRGMDPAPAPDPDPDPSIIMEK